MLREWRGQNVKANGREGIIGGRPRIDNVRRDVERRG